MIYTTKIIIKGFPTNDMENSVYNMNDLMKTTTIIIQDFPTFIMEHFNLKLMGYYHFAKAKLRINVKYPDCPAIFKVGKYNAYASSLMKLKIGPNIKFGFYHTSSSRMLLKGKMRENFHFNAKIRDIKYRQHPVATSKFAFARYRIPSNKAYTIRFDKIIGYWDGFKLGDMDRISNLELGGTLLD